MSSESDAAKDIKKTTPKYQNTGIAQYRFRTKQLDDNHNYSLEEVRCDILSCAKHLIED